MTTEPDGVGSYLKVYEPGSEGMYSSVVISDEGSIDAAVERWISSRDTHDCLLHLTLTDGDTYCVKASRITSWLRSTPEGRRRSAEWNKTLEDELRGYRADAGFIEGQ